jgi:hypothetical protein
MWIVELLSVILGFTSISWQHIAQQQAATHPQYSSIIILHSEHIVDTVRISSVTLKAAK